MCEPSRTASRACKQTGCYGQHIQSRLVTLPAGADGWRKRRARSAAWRACRRRSRARRQLRAARARAQVDAPAARYRSLARVAAAPAPGSASFTQEALQAWREACSGPAYLAAAAALTPLTHTLPQLLHHQARRAPPVWRPGALGSARWPVPPLQSDVACGASARHAGAGPVLRTAVSRARPQPRRRAPDGRRRAGARRRAWRTSSCARSAGRRRCRWRARWRCWRRLRATCRPTSCRTCRARCPRWPTCWTKARAAIGCRAG